MSGSPSYDASASALGYIYQCLMGLLLALRKADDAALTISIEKVDDIAFEENGTAVERLQTKHQVVPGDLKDNTQGLWKTVRIWSDDTRSGKLDPTKTLLFLVTTGSASTGSGLAYLRGDTERNSETARKARRPLLQHPGMRSLRKLGLPTNNCRPSRSKTCSKRFTFWISLLPLLTSDLTSFTSCDYPQRQGTAMPLPTDFRVGGWNKSYRT